MIQLLKQSRLAAFGSAVVLCFSCNSESVDLAKALASSYDYHDKEVTLTGEFDSPFFMFRSQNSTTIPMAFAVKSHAFSSEKVSVSNVILPMGADKNSVVLEMAPDQKQYALKDFNIYDENGEKHNLDTHPSFRISGTVHYSEMDKPETERSPDNFAYEIKDVHIVKD